MPLDQMLARDTAIHDARTKYFRRMDRIEDAYQARKKYGTTVEAFLADHDRDLALDRAWKVFDAEFKAAFNCERLDADLTWVEPNWVQEQIRYDAQKPSRDV